MFTTSIALKIIFLCGAGFLASFVDSIAGGGGLISVPAFLFAGVSPHLALGTNKFCSSSGAFTSAFKFVKSKKINSNLLKFLIPFNLIGAVVGVKAVLKLDESFLYPIVLAMILFVGIYTIFSKSIGSENKLEFGK